MSIVDADAPIDESERAMIASLAAHYPTPRAACIDALRHLQTRRNYISDRTLVAVAELLSLSTAELEEVATFYNLIFRRPVGDHVILLCDSITCWIMGRDRLSTRITARLGIRPGETTADGRVTLLPIVCLGHCDHAPALMVNEILYGDIDADRLDGLIDSLAAGSL